MRAIYSYGVALVIVLVLAVWLASGTLMIGGKGPGQGEKPVVSLIEKNGGPLTNAVDKSGINNSCLCRSDRPRPRPSPSAPTRPAMAPTRRRARCASRCVTAQPDADQVPSARPHQGQVDRHGVGADHRARSRRSASPRARRVKSGDLLCTLDQGARKLAVAAGTGRGRPGADGVRLQSVRW